ncbi:unnamed protein product [Rotaria sp. Silwood2]|nr:unnamed protein product [Rotaria sp. Silwood2]CAF3927943.1 unnamed protein product [Rotaria sp. Silwood2]
MIGSQLDYDEERLDFLIMFNKDNNTESEFYNVLEYACYDQDQCNKLFVHHHIHWLKQVNYTNFQTHLRSILVNSYNHTG